MEVTRNKINYIILIQAFAILTVFVGHATRIFHDGGWYFHKASVDPLCQILSYFVYSFHMPLFIFLSGFLFAMTKKDDFNIVQYVKKRFKRLIIPFLLFGFLYFIPFLRFVNPQNKTLLQIVQDFVLLNQNGHLWFLLTLFIITCALVPILRFKLNKLTQIFILVVLIVLNLLKVKGLPVTIIRSIKYALYFYGGYLFANYNYVFKNLITKKWFFASVIPLWVLSEIARYHDFDNVYISLISATLSILLVFCGGMLLSEKFKDLHDNKVVYFLAANMFMLYILHEPIMVVILKYFNWGVGYNGAIFATCLFFATLAIVSSIILISKFMKNKINKERV